MNRHSDRSAERGLAGGANWLVGGAVGGFVGAVVFGVILWLVDPALVTERIPAIYGLETEGPAGWVFHLAHGVVLGVIFALLLTRKPVLGTLTADVETPLLAAMSPTVRITLAGLVYGLAVWVFLPGVITSMLLTAGVVEDPFPAAATYNLVGHLLYGMFLGALVSLFVDLESQARAAEAPFEEAGDSTGERPDPGTD